MFDANESELNREIVNNLDISLQNAYSRLLIASRNDNFLVTIAPIFGGSGDFSQFQALVDTWGLGDFSQLPTIQILPSSFINGAKGAFSEVNRTIYLSSDYLFQASGDRDSLTGVTGTLLEEIGHFVDSLINQGSDTPGDEGELFSANLMDLSLSSQEKYRISQENDHSFVNLNGQIIPVEQSVVTVPTITVVATDASASETATGITANPGRFTLTRVGNLSSALTVNYTISGTGINGTDYTSIPLTASFVAGASTAVVNISPIDDILDEPSETAILTLGAGTGYSLGTATSARIIIEDNETPVITVLATDASASETNPGITANHGRFTLTRVGNLSSALTVNYTISGTGINGTDYTSIPLTASFAAGASTALVNVNPIDDILAESSETAILTLGAGTGYSLGTATSARVTIGDNETPVITAVATDASASETATGITANPGRFTLTRVGNLSSALTVNYTISGTGINGTDYTIIPLTVSFTAGASTALVNVSPIDDILAEASETAILTLGAGTGYSLGTATSATVTIGDNDPAYITVTSPNGGEVWETGSSYTVTWKDNISENLSRAC